jgi:hypothetical protein
MAYTIQQDSTDLTTYWRAYDVATGADYSGAEIAHDATGLTLLYARNRTAAVTAVTAGSPAPVDLANAGVAHSDWGWCRVAGPFYRADFPDAVAATDLRRTLLAVYGVAGVSFVQVTLADVLEGDPTAAPATEQELADAVLDEVVEGSFTLRQLQRMFAAAMLGKASGLATSTAVFRDLGDTKPRITATVDADGNRSAVTLDAS